MKLFGKKQAVPTDADEAAAARLSAVTARFKPGFTDVLPDPIGEPETVDGSDAVEEPQASEEPEEPDAQ